MTKIVKAKVVSSAWRDHPATYKQLIALNNILLTGKASRKRISLPLTKGEAYDLLQKEVG
jgi:hypothetical protein